jgi:hypothetical protein
MSDFFIVLGPQPLIQVTPVLAQPIQVTPVLISAPRPMITFSHDPPSGGNPGDIWFQY